MKVDIVLGPPGTGKTTALMDELEKLLETYSPSEIAFVTFTKEGALQGVRRACERFKYTQKEFPYFRTLHSLAFQELKLDRSHVMGKQHYRHFSKKMGMQFVGYYTEELSNDDDRYLFFDHLQRNNPKYAAKQIDTFDTDKLNFVRSSYRKYKDFFALYDYTDMIEMYNKSGKTTPVRVVLLDEAQDLTSLQWEMFWRSFKNVERVIIGGDDDQAIFQWSGADVDYFLDVKGSIDILRHSYRLPNSVLDFSKRISGQIVHRADKQFEGTGITGDVRRVNSIEEVVINPDETYMFLARNNCYLTQCEEFVQSKGLVYRNKGKASASKDDIEAINLYEKVRKTRMMEDNEGYKLLSYLKQPLNFDLPWYEAFKWNENKASYFRDIVKNKTDLKKSNITISTIHGVKGGEADHVVMLLDISKAVKNNLDKNPDSEHRVFYVGATRAKKSLTIVESSSKFEYPIY